MIAKDYVPPWVRGDFDYYQLTVCRSTTSVGAQQGTVWRQPLAIAGAFGDDLVAGVGQAVQGAVAEDGVVTVDPGHHSDERIGIVEVVGIEPPSLRRPLLDPSTAGVDRGNHGSISSSPRTVTTVPE